MVDPDLLVRLGGDEFALLITLGPVDDGRQVTERILDRLMQPLVIDGARVRVDASAGVAERDDASVQIADLLRRADVAMYAAKDAHSRVELYQPQLDEANRARLETIQDLDAAFVHQQFILHYQPKIDVATGATFGAEALVRWQHPTRGVLYPDAFLPVVEQSGLMSALTQLVLETAVAQLATWRAAGLDLTVAVNLSASDLLDESLAERIAGLLALHSVPGSALELEITESVIMIDPKRAREVLEALRGARPAHRGRRLRHRLLRPRLSARPPRRRAQDRPVVHLPHRDGPPQCRDRPLHHRARARPRPQGRRGGHRAPGGARCRRGLRLRLRAGLPLQPAAAGRGLHLVDPADADERRRPCAGRPVGPTGAAGPSPAARASARRASGRSRAGRCRRSRRRSAGSR